MKIGIILNTSEEEKAYNAFRLAAYAQNNGYAAKVFLLGEGVEAPEDKVVKFNVREQIDSFIEAGGTILSCKSCLMSRKMGAGASCTISTMKDLLELIEGSDKVISFG